MCTQLEVIIITFFYILGSNGSGSWTNISNEKEDVTNADLGLAEDHFSHPEVRCTLICITSPTPTPTHTTSYHTPPNISSEKQDVTNADLGLAEDHFSHPEVRCTLICITSPTPTPTHTTSYHTPPNISSEKQDGTNADLGLAEDHFSHPEVWFTLICVTSPPPPTPTHTTSYHIHHTQWEGGWDQCRPETSGGPFLTSRGTLYLSI